MRQQMKNQRTAALLLAVMLFVTACSQSAAAAVMQLMRTEGTVGVLDEDGKDVSVIQNMNLYNGYHVGTRDLSYAWINLDDTKLVKMDEDSNVELRKNGKELELFVNSGSLFFNVTEPLGEEERMDIRTSTMNVGIRGTCGWVRILEEDHMQVCLLEGTVQCEVTDPASGESLTESVSAGELADLFFYPDAPEGERCAIVRKLLAKSEVPEFVLTEIDLETLEAELSEESAEEETNGLLKPVFEASGYDGFAMAKNGVMPVQKDGLWGAVNYQNEVVVPFEHTGVQAPDEQGNFVLIDTAVEEQTSEFMGESHTYEVHRNSYTLYDAQGTVLYAGKDPVRASGGMYILLKQGDEQNELAYYRTDGTLVQSLSLDPFCTNNINGFYDGISLVYRSSPDNVYIGEDEHVGYSYGIGTYEVGELDQSGNITWHEDPIYLKYLQTNEEHFQEAVERKQSHPESYGGTGGSSSYLERVPLSTMNHGFYLAGNNNGEAGQIAICNDNYEVTGECNYYDFQPDAAQGAVRTDAYYETNNYRGFYHDGAYVYNYGPNMVWILGEHDVLVDFSLYPGMTSETADSRIVKAVYDQISMSDETYWLVRKGEQWGYIDHDGREAAIFEDASAFYQQYALIVEDGTAWLINEEFEKLQELGEADSVTTYGELFAVTRGDTRYFYSIQ